VNKNKFQKNLKKVLTNAQHYVIIQSEVEGTNPKQNKMIKRGNEKWQRR
jgi:hypothetical protein